MAGPRQTAGAVRRRRHAALWRVVNPLAARVAGVVPWWVLLETTGRRTGRPVRTPLAAGPQDPGGLWLLAVHGRHSGWVRNLEADPRARVRVRGTWRPCTAEVRPLDPAVVARFSRYARSGPQVFGSDPQLVRLEW